MLKTKIKKMDKKSSELETPANSFLKEMSLNNFDDLNDQNY